MDFSFALSQLNSGSNVFRHGWNGTNMFIFLVKDWDYQYVGGKGVSYTKMPYIALKTTYNQVVPWLASQTDILAIDWEILHN